MAKSKLRVQAREMRREGLGVKTIANKLKISSSTASLWCRDIELTEAQIIQLSKNSRDPYFGKRRAYLEKTQEQHRQKLLSLRNKGIAEVGKLNEREIFITGVALYWAEGFKKDKQVGFANSDPYMIQLFIRWIHESCGVSTGELRLRVGANEQYKDKIKDLEKYWSKTIGISLRQFQKPFFQKVQWKKVYDNPREYHGVLRVRVTKSVDLLRTINGQIDGLRTNA